MCISMMSCLCVMLVNFLLTLLFTSKQRDNSKCSRNSKRVYDYCLHGRFVVHQVLEAQMKEDMADKESLESKRAQHQEEAREKCKLISEQKAVRPQSIMNICFPIVTRANIQRTNVYFSTVSRGKSVLTVWLKEQRLWIHLFTLCVAICY